MTPLTQEEINTLKKAADMVGMSLGDFASQAALREAIRVINGHLTISSSIFDDEKDVFVCDEEFVGKMRAAKLN